jgi:hypothetical protein
VCALSRHKLTAIQPLLPNAGILTRGVFYETESLNLLNRRISYLGGCWFA